MHIIVPVKQVPESEDLRYDPLTRTLMREGVTSVLNTFDKRSLTEAMRLRSLYGGHVTAITMGPPQARAVLVEALGRGVDRAVHLTDRAFAGADTLATARTLAAAIRRLPFDLLILGKWSTDSETGQVGPELAELLDVPQVTGATSIELVKDGTLHVIRETDWGFEYLHLSMPALLTSAERLIKPAKTTPEVLEEGARRIEEDPGLIETWGLPDLGLSPGETGLSGSPTWVSELRAVEISRERLVLSGDTVSLAENLLLELGMRGLNSLAETRSAPPLPKPHPHPDPGRGVWAIAESLHTEAGEPRLRRISFELISEAAKLAERTGGETVAVLMGRGVGSLAPQLAQAGATKVMLAEHEALAWYAVETYAWVLARAIRQHRPWAVVLPATSFGRDLAPRVAARLGLGLTGDCIGVELNAEGQLLQMKPAFGGQVVAPIVSRTLPQMATIRPGMFEVCAPDPLRTARIINLDLTGLPQPRARVVRVTREGEVGLALDDARLVVCVGTGIGGPESLSAVRELAARLGLWMGIAPHEIAVGGTRKVVDNGWLPRHQQIGVTGRIVSPDLYVGIGLHGNYNHTAGIGRSGTIVAVNTDPDAPIFHSSDIGILSDWRSFINALLRRLKQEE